MLDKIRMLKIARLAAIITVNTLFFIIGLSIIGTNTTLEFGMLSLFPVVIISFVAERIHHMTDDHDWLGLAVVSTGTLVSIWFCYLILSSFLLEGLFSIYPEFYLLVLAGQIYIGQWTGLRFSELYRFKHILKDKDNPVLSINERNRNLVYARNDKQLLKLAADKLASKQKLAALKVPIPRTLLAITSLSELTQLDDFLAQQQSFALKPNQGSQGNGILIITDRIKNDFISAGGRSFSFSEIKKHCIEIISGSFSQSGEDDAAYFEPLLVQHYSLQKLAPYGLSDIRLIISEGKVVSAMLRMPTKGSDGKANLHQGAVGVAIDIKTGVTTNAKLKQNRVTKHPDNGELLVPQQIPFWNDILAMAVKSQQAIQLGYMGVDICIDEKIGPIVLEVNGRPGIEIQNVQNRGLYAEF
ncbi:MAG: sugar-transfer associated ATP-grasp domain-containing protein [Enterobacterales bacterium]|nr:sugar-transfer associated ATP-grasp domain-containing protein [Enterobacterales bacterium]